MLLINYLFSQHFGNHCYHFLDIEKGNNGRKVESMLSLLK